MWWDRCPESNIFVSVHVISCFQNCVCQLHIFQAFFFSSDVVDTPAALLRDNLFSVVVFTETLQFFLCRFIAQRDVLYHLRTSTSHTRTHAHTHTRTHARTHARTHTPLCRPRVSQVFLSPYEFSYSGPQVCSCVNDTDLNSQLRPGSRSLHRNTSIMATRIISSNALSSGSHRSCTD